MIVNPSGKRRIFKRKAFRYVFAAGLLLLLMGLIFLPAMPKQSDSVFPDYAKDTLPHLNLLIGEAQMKKIQEKRSEAFKTGILVTDETDELQAKLVYNGQSANALIRLKGDWVDHLKGQKWSFRINLEPPHTFSQLSDFSIQAPATRSFLSEWFFHQLLKEEGILTTKFEFVHLLLNGQNKGLFAYEEHFTKHIPESGFRREGPLLKISEEGMWNARVLQEELGVFILEEPEPFYPGEAAPFKSGQILKDTVLAREFSIARNLLHQFKYKLATDSDLMDIGLTVPF